jgi:hypothetical protein
MARRSAVLVTLLVLAPCLAGPAIVRPLASPQQTQKSIKADTDIERVFCPAGDVRYHANGEPFSCQLRRQDVAFPMHDSVPDIKDLGEPTSKVLVSDA